MSAKEQQPVYVVTRGDIDRSAAIRAAVEAWEGIDCSASCEFGNEEPPIIIVEVADETLLLRIIAEGVLRTDWVSVAAEGEDRESAFAAVIGPTTGAGPILLAATGMIT